MRLSKIIDKGFLILLGLLCILYSIYASTFAETHLQLPFLNFPVFIGEIALMIFSLWMAFRWYRAGCPWVRSAGFFVGYAAWLLIKATVGYTQYGPLAFRNAALFYYPFFAVISYYLIKNQDLFLNRRKAVLFFMLILAIKSSGIFSYFFLPYLILAVICLMNFHSLKYQILGAIILLIFFPPLNLFDAGRAALLGQMAAIIFLSVVFIFYFIGVGRKTKWILFFGVLIILLTGLLCFTSKSKLNSLTKIQPWIQAFLKQDRFIQAKKKSYKIDPIKPQLYHADEKEPDKKDPTTSEIGAVSTSLRYLALDRGNIVFRLFIWRDMYEEYLKKNWIIGVSFGQPLRSVSIEILRLAWGEWSRDGWIMPHNAFLHMIYRGGVVGFMLCAGIIGVWIYMVKTFIQKRFFVGILLCSILLYWIVVAAFSVTLELPYQAIPFWSLWGLAFAYSIRAQERIIKGK